MRNLEQLQWLKNSTLQEIKTEDAAPGLNNEGSKGKQIVFKLQGDINH
jgi:Tfp pilus assembly protein PilN